MLILTNVVSKFGRKDVYVIATLRHHIHAIICEHGNKQPMWNQLRPSPNKCINTYVGYTRVRICKYMHTCERFLRFPISTLHRHSSLFTTCSSGVLSPSETF